MNASFYRCKTILIIPQKFPESHGIRYFRTSKLCGDPYNKYWFSDFKTILLGISGMLVVESESFLFSTSRPSW